MKHSSSLLLSNNMKTTNSLFHVLLLFAVFQPSYCQENDNGTNNWKTSRKYKYLNLENGLKVILIEDPYSAWATGSLHVAAGSMSNPKDVQGLAHLLEHMVFNKNSKYPEPAQFYKYASDNGGDVEAYTGMDYTEYKFAVLPNALQGALDHLFHMVNSPLLQESSIREEVIVVNSEHAKNVPQDTYGYQEITRQTAREGHPFKTFPTGNEETLWIKPQQLGIDVHKELVKYYEEYYSSNLMTLAVFGNNSLAELEEMVVEIFSKLKNRNTTMPSWWNNPPYGPSELGVKIEIVPKGGLQYLSLEFPIPAEEKDVFDNYYVSLFSGGGSNSLSNLLKSANLANGLQAAVSNKYRGFYTFSIVISLTDFGVIQHQQVTVCVFEFINLLRKHSPEQWYWDEVKELEDIEQRFKPKVGASDLVSALGKVMLEITTETEDEINLQLSSFNLLIEAHNKDDSKTRAKFNATQVTDALNYVTPEIMRMYFASDSLPITPSTLVDPNYKIQYNVGPIDPELCKILKTAESNLNLKFPTKNNYIPKNFTIKTLPENERHYVPEMTKGTQFSLIWFLKDNFYFVPKVLIRFKLFNPYAYATPMDSVLNGILSSALEDLLSLVTSAAGVAGTTIQIQSEVFGLEVSLYGYNDGIDVILYKVMDIITSASFTNETFNACKEICRQLINATFNSQPCTLANPDRILKETYWSPEMLYESLKDISLNELESFYRKFMSRVKLEWIIYGNIFEEEAIQLVKSSETYFIKKGSHPGTGAAYKWQLRDIQILKGTSWLYKMKSSKHSSTCTRVTFQSPSPSLNDLVQITLLADFMSQPAYVELRAKEQLGYNVAVFPSSEIGHSSNSLGLYVQGERDPVFVEGRINNFLVKFRETLLNMTEKEFEEHKSVQKGKWNLVSSRMSSYGFTFWTEIFYGHYIFYRDYHKQNSLNRVTLKQLQQFYDELIGFQGNTQKRLSIHVLPITAVVNETDTSGYETTIMSDVDETTYDDIINTETTATLVSDEETATTETPFVETHNPSTTPTPYILKNLNESSLINLEVDNGLELNILNSSTGSFREAKALEKLTRDFLNKATEEIIDYVAWKREQYLYPTYGL